MESQEKELQSKLAIIRRKRLEREHKHLLIEQLHEKQMRQQNAKMMNEERANHSYLTGIQMRDHFYATVQTTSALHQPQSFERHFADFKTSEWAKPKKDDKDK